MPITDLLLEGVNLMLVGMGIVFLFLTILVLTMIGMSKLARQFDDGSSLSASSSPLSITPGGGDDREIVAVISAAISRYRSKIK